MILSAVQALQLTLVVVSLVFAGACFLGWRLFEHPRHALIWSGAFLLAALQYGLNLMRDAAPSYEWWWVTVNVVSCLLVLGAVLGHRVRLGLASPAWALLAIVAAVAVIQVVFTLILPRDDVRVALGPGFACIAFLHIAWVLHRHGPEPRLAQYVAAGVQLSFGLAQGLAAIVALQFGQESTAQQRDAYNLVNFALMPTFFVAMGVTVIFLLATDLSNRLRLQAITDQLTQVGNRRGFLIAADLLMSGARRHQRPLAAVLADIDHFKQINDRYGHAVGDRTLAHFSQILRDCVRSADAIGRVGGEEFAIMMGDSSTEDAGRMVARVQQMLLERPLLESGQVIALTASFGIAELHGEDDKEDLLLRADQALYEAKASGRDAVRVAGNRHLVGMVSHG
ncbi:MAG: GGDEF domain-containing protein [Halieaceae bacterium]|uniref:GGDEF domain-containing protein n=1 Tax=Haliea alexandrii TaxID=2448162 RepID=UPI000F0B0F78|nr:GGDEF domain-containing protein [Haliea alexandrii]MCR9185600.1 GGDEF domain-containing protein [Halieaceae bacterium]